MPVFKKFKLSIGEDLYKQKVKEFALNHDVSGAVRLCGTCSQLEFDHKPGPCTRTEKIDIVKYSSDEINEIVTAINQDVVKQIIENTKTGFAKLSPADKNSSNSDESKTSDKLADALDKIASVLEQQRQGPAQVIKVKSPPFWAGECFADYRAEVEAWEQAHTGETFTKYSEFINELKRNKTKPGLSDYVSKIIIEKTKQNKSVKSILDALQEKYELTKKEKFAHLIDLMKSFKANKSQSGEALFSKIEKIGVEFESLQLGKNIKYYLVTFLLKDLSENDVLNDIEKRSIEDLIESQNDASIMSEFKKWFMRTQVEGKREKCGTSNDTGENKTYYVGSNDRSRYGSWKNSRDFRDYSRTNSNNWRTKSGNRWRKSESTSRNKSVSQSRRSNSNSS